MFDLETIQKFIPHRPPLLLIDQITSCVPFESVQSTLTLKPEAWYFQGHFPHNPVFPGVLSLEFMGQTAAFLMTYSCDQSWGHKNIYLMSIDNAKFRQAARPADTLHCVTKLERQKGNIFKLFGEIFVDQALICSAYCMLMMSE